MAILIDGSLSDWSPDMRLETADTLVPGYELYGTIEDAGFIVALRSAEPIGTNTTFWLNTDNDSATGYQIWGWAGGAEFNVHIEADGKARLYAGAEREVLVAELDYALGPDGTTLELVVPKALVGDPSSLSVLADINDTVFLPANYGLGGYLIAEPVPDPVSSFDGLLDDWSQDQRLETPQTLVSGYELYGRVDTDQFAIAIRSAVPIGANTTFWLNTDADATTGHQIWGWAGGAEFNVRIEADGRARLYAGAEGETFITEVDYALGPDGTTLEMGIPKAPLGGAAAISVLADINDTVFLPANYGFGGYTIAEPTPPPVSTFDGVLDEWAQSQRLETALTMVEGYELYGRVDPDTYVFAVRSAEPIGANTTFWLNADGDASTGHLVWDWAVGAEFNVRIEADGRARLYAGAEGETLLGELDFALGPDGTTLEMAVPKALIGSPSAVTMFADINDTVFLPADYSLGGYKLTDPASLPPVEDADYKVGIVFSETTAAAYFSEMAYSQLVMAAQSQAMAAGIPFDLLGEADLTDLAKLAEYDALVFPSFRNVPANHSEIVSVLTELVQEYDVPLVTAGDFMTNAADGSALPGNPYATMQTLLGVTRVGGDSGVQVQIEGVGDHPIVDGYEGATIHTYANASTSYFDSMLTGSEIIAQQIVGGTAHNAVIGTQTGGRNVHFATEGIMADSNLLGSAVDWVTAAPGPSVSLHMTRNEAIVASRNDMDQSQETFDVDGGIYDALLPILQQWKQDYNFVGSYYVNVGLYPPDQETNWFISSAYYQQLLAMGNEIGSHSYSHPSDTNLLLPDVITQEILDARIAAYAQLTSDPVARFTPYALREDADPAVIDALAAMSVAEINQTMQAALAAPDPVALDPVSKAILEASFTFQFERSIQVIEANLGIDVTGTAVPGMPESLETARQIIQFADYLSGGASLVGAGYPGAFGYLSPADTGQVYLAPNTSFDFTLIDWLNLTAEEASAAWVAEWNDLTVNSDMPIVVWPWHDYGPTQWSLDDGELSEYSLEMFSNFIATAYDAGAEFVTLADLAERIATFEQTQLTYAIDGNTINVEATPASGSLGTFALDLDALGGQTIQSVANWYAYDGDSVFLDADGGTFDITLGSTQTDVTHITSIGARAKLVSLNGDGTNLDFVISGEGDVVIDLKQIPLTQVQVSGATVVSQDGDILTLRLEGIGTHTVSVNQTVAVNTAAIMTASTEDMARIITAKELGTLAGVTGTFAIAGLAASSSVLAAQAGGDWLFTPDLDDDTEVTFTYTVETDSGSTAMSATMDLIGMTDVTGTTNADSLAAKATADQYHGLAGNDTIRGGGGNDIIFGDAGADSVNGNAGDDIIVAMLGDGNDSYTGGAGIDTYDLTRTGADAVVNLAARSASSVETGTDFLGGVENVTGGSGNDTLTGNGAANILIGGAGDDRLDGAGGKDLLTGGAGNDVFVFRNINHTSPGARDVITDLTPGEDLMDLSAIDAQSEVGGNQAFTFVTAVGAAFSGVPGELVWEFADAPGEGADATVVSGDINGDQVADFQIELTGLVELTALDFIL